LNNSKEFSEHSEIQEIINNIKTLESDIAEKKEHISELKEKEESDNKETDDKKENINKNTDDIVDE